MLKEAWFGHFFCGPSLGFAKEHRTSDNYVSCLLCRKDIKIGSRGLSTYAEHHGGSKHYRLDWLYRIQKSLPLCSRDGTLLEGSARNRLFCDYAALCHLISRCGKLTRFSLSNVLVQLCGMQLRRRIRRCDGAHICFAVSC